MATVTLDSNLYNAAMLYAKEHETSVHKLFEGYVVSLLSLSKEGNSESVHLAEIANEDVDEIPEFIRTMSAKVDFPQDFDVKRTLHKHWIEKYG